MMHQENMVEQLSIACTLIHVLFQPEIKTGLLMLMPISNAVVTFCQ